MRSNGPLDLISPLREVLSVYQRERQRDVYQRVPSLGETARCIRGSPDRQRGESEGALPGPEEPLDLISPLREVLRESSLLTTYWSESTLSS